MSARASSAEPIIITGAALTWLLLQHIMQCSCNGCLYCYCTECILYAQAPMTSDICSPHATLCRSCTSGLCGGLAAAPACSAPAHSMRSIPTGQSSPPCIAQAHSVSKDAQVGTPLRTTCFCKLPIEQLTQAVLPPTPCAILLQVCLDLAA